MALKDRLKNFNLQPEVEGEHVISPELISLSSELSKELSIKTASIPLWFDYTEEEQKELILNFLNAKLNDKFTRRKLSEAEKDRIAAIFLNSVYGFGSIDFLIAQQNINTIFVKSDGEIFIDFNGQVIKSDITIDKKQSKALINKLIKLSNRQSSVISFRFNNLFVTIIREPVCSQQLVIKKISAEEFNFEYLENKEIINSDIAEFLKSCLAAGKKFLISAPRGLGKTIFLNSLINEIQNDKRIVLFEDDALINSASPLLERYNIGELPQNAQEQLLKAVISCKPDFIFSDINDTFFNINIADLSDDNTGFIACITADSAADAIVFYSSALAAKYKYSEQFAKTKCNKYFDYVIQLEKNNEIFIIKTILETSGNDSSNFTEKLVFNAGEYKYDFKINADSSNNSDMPNIPLKKNSFSARLTDK